MTPTGFGKLCDNIAPAVFVWAVLHTVIGIFCLPEAESVVVLCRYDNALHSCGFYRSAPAVTVEIDGIKNRGIFFARAPFEIRICVRAEMNKRIKRCFGQKTELICARLYVRRLLYEIIHFRPPLLKFYSTKYSRQSEPL